MLSPIQAVLFDLDGTLVDSAPDLAGTLNDMRLARGWQAWPEERLREHCGSGARGMLGEGMQVTPDHADYLALRSEFLNLYEARLLRLTRVFPAVAALLDELDARDVAWGIVTNKALRFAQPLCEALALLPRSRVLVGGDSTPHTKPHPAPLLEAARLLDRSPQACVYVGDDHRDVMAGRSAGMRTWVAAWGYTGGGAVPVQSWGADAVLDAPDALLKCLDLP